MVDLIRHNSNSGLWQTKPFKRKARSSDVVATLESKGYYGNAIGHYSGSFLDGDVIFKVDEKNYNETEIYSTEDVNLGTLDWNIDVFKNINWKQGPIQCSLKGFNTHQISKRYDSMLDSKCNIYYDYLVNNRIVATTTIDFHSFFKIKRQPIRFNIISRGPNDPDQWFIALISLYIHSIDGRFQAKSM